MNSMRRAIYVISADAVVAQSCVGELAAAGSRYATQVASTVEQARQGFGRHAPVAIFLDESAIEPATGSPALEPAVALLTEYAPVVVAAAPEQQTTLAFLITSGAVDFVARTSCPSSRACWIAGPERPSASRGRFNFAAMNCPATSAKFCATK